MNIFKPGTKVKLLDLDMDSIYGIICSVNITQERIVYEVAYWVSNQRHKEWFEEFEIVSYTGNSVRKIGFK